MTTEGQEAITLIKQLNESAAKLLGEMLHYRATGGFPSSDKLREWVRISREHFDKMPMFKENWDKFSAMEKMELLVHMSAGNPILEESTQVMNELMSD